jgi:ABC-type phosphate/phosphonate transport system substrate-binding protein
MYNATPAAAAAWRALLARAFEHAGVTVEFIEHGFPKPIDTLWREPELFGAFMCGWPFSRADRAMQAIAAPVPSPAKYEGLPRYRSEFLVRATSGWTTVEQTFWHRIGWMSRDSQSGFNAPRHFLSALASGEPLYAESHGPYVAPMKTLDALRNQEVDVIALDGFFLDLLRHHDPARLEGLATVAETPWTPIPLLVAAPGVEREAVDRLRAALLALGRGEGEAEMLDAVLLRGFATPRLDDYAVFESMAREAKARGYAEIL